MNRSIKFRAWDSEENKMIYTEDSGLVLFMLRNIGDGIDAEEAVPDNSEDGFYRKKLEHLQYMQFTGLHDKNGVEIYEGDIFKCSLGCVASVEWEKEGRFIGFTSERSILYVNREPAVEVIGNIYQHPHLLEWR